MLTKAQNLWQNVIKQEQMCLLEALGVFSESSVNV